MYLWFLIFNCMSKNIIHIIQVDILYRCMYVFITLFYTGCPRTGGLAVNHKFLYLT